MYNFNQKIKESLQDKKFCAIIEKISANMAQIWRSKRAKMLAKRIIPCLDIKDGRVVKGVNFVGLQDAGDPVEIARKYNEQGADELVFLDISASVEKRLATLEVVRSVAKEVFIPFSVGGGVNSVEDMSNLLNAGCDKISLNSSAVKNPALITQGAEKFGSQCVIVAVDYKKVSSENLDSENECLDSEKGAKYSVFINGGRVDTGIDLFKWCKKVQDLGAGELLLTSMDTDGVKRGYDNAVLKKISEMVQIPIIASGGAGEMRHFSDAFKLGGADAALAASVFHYGEICISDLKQYLKNDGVEVRV